MSENQKQTDHVFGLAVCEDETVVPVSLRLPLVPPVATHPGPYAIPHGCHTLIVIDDQERTALIWDLMRPKATDVSHAHGLAIGHGAILPVPRLTSEEEETADMYAGLGFTYVDFETLNVRRPDGTVYSLRPLTNDMMILRARQAARQEKG